MSSLESLSQTENGRKVLKEQIQHDDNNPNRINCYFYKKNGDKIGYSVPINNVVKGYKKVFEKQPNEIIRSVDISVNEYEKKYKTKHIISDLRDTFEEYKFEFNMPSNFMQMITGVKPRVIGETNCNLDLRKYKNEVLELFEKLDKEKKHSFVISTGIKSLEGHKFHVYILEDVNMSNNTITVREKRENVSKTMSIEEALKTFKCIVGYLNSDLEKTV